MLFMKASENYYCFSHCIQNSTVQSINCRTCVYCLLLLCPEIFSQNVKGKLYSKFGVDRSNIVVTV